MGLRWLIERAARDRPAGKARFARDGSVRLARRMVSLPPAAGQFLEFTTAHTPSRTTIDASSGCIQSLPCCLAQDPTSALLLQNLYSLRMPVPQPQWNWIRSALR